MGQVVPVDVGEVLVAALGDEGGLGHDGQAEVGDRAQQLDGDDRTVLDPVPRAGAGDLPGDDGEHGRDPGHAVDGDVAIVVWASVRSAARSSSGWVVGSSITSFTGPGRRQRENGTPAARSRHEHQPLGEPGLGQEVELSGGCTASRRSRR